MTVEDEVALAMRLYDHLVAGHQASERDAAELAIRSTLSLRGNP